jgi:hypothetical protein
MPEPSLPLIGQPSMQELLLSKLDTSDPTTAMLAQMIASQSANQSEKSESTIDIDEDETQARKLKQLTATCRQLRQGYETLQTEMEDFRLRNDTLAAALGACYLCWGENTACENCDGQGTVGFFSIDVPAFSEFIAPALRAFKNQTRRLDAGSTLRKKRPPSL